MKKVIFIILAVLCLKNIYAQNAAAVNNSQLKKNTISVSDQNFKMFKSMPDNSPVDNGSFYKLPSGNRVGGDAVGYTSYDLVTNGSAPGRLLVYPDNKVTTVWTGSKNLTLERLDRGTFFNSYDGASWGPEPDERIEDYRTGFPAIINVGDHEMYFAHDGTNNLAIYENDAIGSGNWTANPNSLMLHGSWPRAAHAEGSNYIHLLAANDDAANENDYMLYYRSSDGGDTWDINEYRLPGIDTANGYTIMGAESYVIRAIGSTVYIAAGTSINDLAVWKSESNGDIGTWTRTELIEFPFPNFNGNSISDITGDGIADTLTTHDGSIAMAIDNDGMMHVWAGVTYVLDVEANDNAWTFFPGVAGMWYWNETFGADSVQYLDFPLVDWDEDGDPFAGIGADLPNYGCGFTSQPSAAVDPETGYIYLVYTLMVEYTDYFDDPTVETAQSFRDLFGFYSTDNGVSWSEPINLSYVAEQQYENVCPTVYWSTVDDKVHVLWLQDQEPGNSLETEDPDAITTENDILYRAFDFSRFEPYDPTAEYDYSGPANVIEFNNLSQDASSYSWNFGDGGTSTQAEPAHIFPAIGEYLVTLNAVNKYGDDHETKTIQITAMSSITTNDLEKNIKVYPTVTSGIVTINNSVIDEDVVAELFTATGDKLMEQNINKGTATIDISNYATGQYFIRFKSRSAVAVEHISLIK